MSIAPTAPRPLYVASAAGDLWSDPKGEFLSAWHAGEVYSLFGQEGVGTDEMPALDHSVGHRINYHIRTGKHDVTLFDWQQYIRFAKEQWGYRHLALVDIFNVDKNIIFQVNHGIH